MSDEMKIKVAVLGAGAVGKSCLTLRLTTDGFEDDYDPTIADLYETVITVDGKTCSLDITDTAGQQEYMNLVDEWIVKGEGFMLVCSVDSVESVDTLHEVRNKIILLKNSEKVPMVIANNKCDLSDRKVPRGEVESLAKEWGCPFFETSAKASTNVKEAFEALVREIRKAKKSKEAKKNSKKKATKKKKKVCTIL